MTETQTLPETLLSMGRAARAASRQLAQLTAAQKDGALRAMAAAVRARSGEIQHANERDIVEAKKKGLAPSLLDRLVLNEARIEAMARALEAVAEQADPVGSVLATFQRPNGLLIQRVRVPLGVIGVIYESRPNVTADAAGLCLKAGNAVILRGGSDSFHSSTAILKALHVALTQAGLPEAAVQMVPTSERSAVKALLKMDSFIDVLIPRGGPQLLAEISAESRIPLLKHLAGLCHTYVHTAADPEMAKKVVLNAKMRRTGICGATEVLLVDRAVLATHMPAILKSLLEAGCEIRGDQETAALDKQVKPVGAADYDTEFLAPILAVKVVNGLDEALAHIARHSTQHTEAIITEDAAIAARFLREVDSAIVMHNASTQFADGGEFGMGAEIGIATGKLHARGPVGAEQLTTFKYWVQGKGQLRPT
jgi:glutamate-5-semialdehyde dehydrogenase